MRKIKYILAPIILTIGFVCIFNIFLDKEIKKLSIERDMSQIRHEYGFRVRDRGSYFRELFASKGDLSLLGSSELGSPVPQNPINLFPFNDATYDLSVFGVAHIQNLQHATFVGGSRAYNKDSKMALIVSLQWFEGIDGMSAEEFLPGFSEVQFYEFLSNPKVSKENKEYFARRVLGFLSSANMFTEERFYANIYLRKSLADKAMYYLTKPYFKLKENILKTRDKVAALRELRKMPSINEEKDIKKLNFVDEYIKAEEQGNSEVTNNSFYAQDEYYDKYLRDIYENLKNINGDIDVIKSKEFDDFKFYLDVCKDLDVKPYIILMNVNGWYYDYSGIDENERTEFYNKLQQIAEEKGFDVLNLQSHEYEKYYLIDVMHLGWKGWINVSEEMYKHFKK